MAVVPDFVFRIDLQGPGVRGKRIDVEEVVAVAVGRIFGVESQISVVGEHTPGVEELRQRQKVAEKHRQAVLVRPAFSEMAH